MAQVCGFCEEEIGEVPKLELLCHHFFHTNCFLVNMGDQCPVCEEPFLPEEQQEEEDEAASVDSNATTGAVGTRVLNLYNTNAAFRKDIKQYSKALSSISKPKKELQKLVRDKKTELSPAYALIKAQYEGLYNTKKDEIVNATCYKSYKNADARARRLYTNLGTKYRVYSYHFPALQTLRGLKRLRGPARWRYYSRPSTIIRRGLRLRLGWW